MNELVTKTETETETEIKVKVEINEGVLRVTCNEAVVWVNQSWQSDSIYG